MKAYQMKITLKDSNPAIWRRCIVPAGLSFIQLSVVLNEVMGWSKGHLSKFEFYHSKIRFLEGMSDDSLDEYDEYESSEYIIDEFMETEEWFSYYSDLSDCWEHRVTIEKVLDDYEWNYPVVMKFKENTPYEDCGGIETYYNILEILNDPSHPKHEEVKEWADNQFTDEYDLDVVNKLLSAYRLTDEKSDPMTQEEIYGEISKNHCSFKRIQGKRELELELEPLSEDSLRALFDDLGDMTQDWEEARVGSEKNLLNMALAKYPEDLSEVTLETLYQNLNKETLVDICKKHHLKGHSKFNKPQLAEFVGKRIVCREEIRKYFLFLTEEEIRFFDQGMEKGEYVHKWMTDPQYIVDGGYAVELSLKYVLIPGEVWQVYEQHCDTQWKKKWQEIQELLALLNGAALLYGVCPWERFQQLYERYTARRIEEKELVAFLDFAPQSKIWFRFENSEIIASKLNEKQTIQELKCCQRDKEFYVPTKEELLCLGKNGYLPFDKSMIKLRSYIERTLKEEREAAELYCKEIQEIIRTGGEMQEVIQYLDDEYVLIGDELPDLLLTRLNEVFRNTRLLMEQGFTYGELGIQKHPKNGNYQEKKTKKIYPNDKCPCGSGKKYKHCCGKGKRV